jgi:hypothetical protein
MMTKHLTVWLITLGVYCWAGGAFAQTQEVVLEPPPLVYMPPHTGGDQDFWGDGPDVFTWVQLWVKEQYEVRAFVYMCAREPDWDYTEACDGDDFWVYTHHKPIAAILSPTSDTHSYFDTNRELDRFGFSEPGRLFDRLEYVGNTKGPEAGSRTKVFVFLRPITLLEQMD